MTIELAPASPLRAPGAPPVGADAFELGAAATEDPLGGGVLAASADAARPPLKLGTTNRALHWGQMPRRPANSAFTCN
jgi:hypothetical protein